MDGIKMNVLIIIGHGLQKCSKEIMKNFYRKAFINATEKDLLIVIQVF